MREAQGLHVAPCAIADIEGAPNLASLAEEFADETLVTGLPRSDPNWPAYRALEAAGMLHPIANPLVNQGCTKSGLRVSSRQSCHISPFLVSGVNSYTLRCPRVTL